MHRKNWNSLRLSFALRPRGPLLVKSGMASVNPSLPDMQFVRTTTPQGETVFIPGSSLKGVFRSFTEKVLRTVGEKMACDPLDKENNCVHLKNLEKCSDTARVYRESCLACKMYGNTRLRGRVAFTDAFPEGPWKTETRYGVAISRLTNAVSNLFDMEVLVEGTFSGSILLENFEIWQLGLIGLTVQSLNEGLVRVGFGKSRGFGEVTLEVKEAVFTMAQKEIPGNELWGVGAFVDEKEQKSYGFREDDRLVGVPEGTREETGLYIRITYGPREWQEIQESAVRSLHVLEGLP